MTAREIVLVGAAPGATAAGAAAAHGLQPVEATAENLSALVQVLLGNQVDSAYVSGFGGQAVDLIVRSNGALVPHAPGINDAQHAFAR